MPKRRFILLASIVALVVLAAVVFTPAARRHFQSVQCANQLHVILYVAALEWPTDHDGHLPTSFLSMSNALMMPLKILVCPADHSRQPASSWASLTEEHCSYEIVAPGLQKTDTNTVFLRCKIHGYTGYADDRLLDASGRLISPNRVW